MSADRAGPDRSHPARSTGIPRLFDELRPRAGGAPALGPPSSNASRTAPAEPVVTGPGVADERSSAPAAAPVASTEDGTEPGTEPVPEHDAGRGGRLAPEARRAVVGLLKQGVLLASERRLLYEAVCRHRSAIESHLADMYLRLLLDEREGVVVLLQQMPEEGLDNDEDEQSVALTARRPLTLYDTLLVLVLRRYYQERQSAGESSVRIDLDHIESRLTPFLALATSSRNERRRLSGALERMIERRILARVRGDEQRFEITSVIRYVVNAEVLERLLAQYQALADGAEASAGGEGHTPVTDLGHDEDDHD